MRKIGEVLRLKAAGLNIRDIAVSTGVGKTTVYEYLARAEAAGAGLAVAAGAERGGAGGEAVSATVGGAAGEQIGTELA